MIAVLAIMFAFHHAKRLHRWLCTHHAARHTIVALHNLAAFLVAVSALLYLTAAIGFWHEQGHAADVFGCAATFAVNRPTMLESEGK